MIRGVVFDLGGTLHLCSADPERKVLFARRIIARLGEYGIAVSTPPEALAAQLEKNAAEYKRAAEESLREMPPEIVWNDYYLREQALGRETLAPIAEELSFLYDYERVCNMRRPRLIETMELLKAQGLKLGVISNILARSFVPHMIMEYGLTPYMDCVLSSAGTGIRKPDPAIFRMAEEALGLAPPELAYVGDTLSRDVRGTRYAGWRLAIQIWSPTAARRDAGLAEQGWRADYQVRELWEIPDIIASENRKEAPL